MNIFDIIGPIMIGPSSSHTAGAVKIGQMAARMLNERPVKAEIKLHGSFAKTYKGHGTDRAIIGGLLGMFADDERISKSFKVAEEEGLKFDISTIELNNAHPNTASIEITGVSGEKLEVIGESVGGGSIFIKKINGLPVEFSGEYNTLIVKHVDKAGVIASITDILAGWGVNIAGMRVYRSKRGGTAVMVIESDQDVNASEIEQIRELPHIETLYYIKSL